MRPLWSSELDNIGQCGHFSSFSTNIIARRAPEAVGTRTWPQFVGSRASRALICEGEQMWGGCLSAVVSPKCSFVFA